MARGHVFRIARFASIGGLRLRSLRRIANAKLSIRNEGAFGSPAIAADGERFALPSPKAPTSMPSEALMDAIPGNKGKQYRIRRMNGDVNRIRSVGAESWTTERLLEKHVILLILTFDTSD